MNPFDQFDNAATPPASNPFDQFDSPPQSPQLPSAGPLPPGALPGPPFNKLAGGTTGQLAPEPSMNDAKYLIDEGLVAGIDNLAGAPVDLASMVLTGLSRLGAAGANLVLPDDKQITPWDFSGAPGGSQWLHDLYLEGERQAGRPVIAPEDVGMTTRVGAKAVDFGVQGAAGGTGLSTVAARQAAEKGVEALPPMLQAYAKRPAATIATDTAAGAGAGTADQIAEENGITNPIVRFILDSAGGYGGARATQAVVSPAAAAQAIIDKVLPDPKIPTDTVLGFGTNPSRADAQATARRLQEAAINPQTAAQNVKDLSLEARDAGITPPTSGQLSNDPGLLYLEKRARLASPSNEVKDPRGGSAQFVERDRQVQEDLSNAVKHLGPEGANPRVPTDQVTQEVQSTRTALEGDRRAAAQANQEAQAQTAQRQSEIAQEREQRLGAMRQREQQATDAGEAALENEKALGGRIQANQGGKTAASETIATTVGEAKAVDQQRKSGLYREAEQLATDRVDARPYAAEVADIKRKLQPLASTDRAVANAMPDFEALLNPETGQGSIGVRDLIQMLPRLSAAQKSAVANMRGDVAEAIGRISSRIKSDLTERAKQGDEAALAWSAAERNFETQFAPKYREGVGGQLDRAERRGQPVPPSAQGGMFLKPRGGGKEAAADLNRILENAPNAAAGKAAARDYVMSDLATLVGENGTISPNRLKAWRANHEGMLSQLPEVRAEVDKLIVDVVNRRENTNAAKRALDAAVAERKGTKLALDRREKEVMANSRLTEKQKTAEIAKIDQERGAYERDLQDNAVRHLVDADPRTAVGNVMGARDPERAMSQIAEKFKGDKEATAGWKRAVADWLYEKASLAGAPDTTGGLDPVSLNKVAGLIRQHRATLSKVFSPQEMQTLQRVEKFLDISARKGIGATTGSQTAENLNVMNMAELAMKFFLGNLEGGGRMRQLKLSLSMIPGTPKGARIDRLIERAMLDPDLMHHLLTIPLKDSMIPQWNRTLTRMLAVRNTFAESASDE